MSHIKGGGRAPLSDEVEDDLISLLISIRDPDTKLSSNHDRKREHRRFVKKLVERHERRSLARRVNNGDGDTLETKTKSQQLKIASNPVASSPSSSGVKKVRVELVEAVFGKPSKKSGKAGKDRLGDFKEGSKKIMVFSNTSTVDDVLKEAKSKLRMKKKPTRCFVVEKKITMDLTGDLRGIKDGGKVYVTSQEIPRPSKEEKVAEAFEKCSIDDGGDAQESESDPLDAVKNAYIRRKRPRYKARQFKVISRHPRFQDHFDELLEIPPERSELPAASCRENILQALDDERILVICGHTGCGKSTQIPQFLLEGMIAAGKEESTNIIVTQPRRVAAISLAQRVANEMKSAPPGSAGAKVGYNVRLDRAVTDTAKIVYCTIGILLRMLVCPKESNDVSGDLSGTAAKQIPLSNVTHIVIDEVHERDVNTDFVLTLLRQILMLNKNIRIILMSATAAADLFVQYFSEIGMKPSVIEIAGRTFPVDIQWIADCERFAGTRLQGWSPKFEIQHADRKKVLSPRASAKIDNAFIRDLIKAIVKKQQVDGNLSPPETHCRRKDGAILVFLPGKGEIDALAKVLYAHEDIGNRDKCIILKLHSSIPKGEQQAVFVPAKSSMVKIILATNIAETSLTISDVSHVIDTGRVKESRFNSSTRIKELVTVWTSQASAKQRSGRAGRTTAGTCWRLYSEEFAQELMPGQTSPEILRTPLDELILQLALLHEHKLDEANAEAKARASIGVCPIQFLSKTPEPPSEDSVVEACKHLLEVGALSITTSKPQVLYRLTPMGYHLSRLPMDAKVGKVLIVGCMLGCLENSVIVAAALSVTKSCFPSRWGHLSKVDWEHCLRERKDMVERGFGGSNWIGGTVKGDLIASIAAFQAWRRQRREKDRAAFCAKHGIDNAAMRDISSLCSQFTDCICDAGFAKKDFIDPAKDDALLTSCCLVAGLYPNIATLMRPRKGGPKGGRLLTKDGDICRPNSGSFQTQRLRNASENGKDAYAVFHAKHRSIGSGNTTSDVFLSEVNFVSRFALMLFGGELVVEKNALIVDGWLKFKVGDKGTAGALLIQELRTELENIMLGHIESLTTKT